MPVRATTCGVAMCGFFGLKEGCYSPYPCAILKTRLTAPHVKPYHGMDFFEAALIEKTNR